MPRSHILAKKEKLAALKAGAPFGISVEGDDALEEEDHFYDSDQSWG